MITQTARWSNFAKSIMGLCIQAERQRHKSTSSTNQEKSSSSNGLDRLFICTGFASGEFFLSIRIMLKNFDRRFSQSLCDLNSITIRPKSGKVIYAIEPSTTELLAGTKGSRILDCYLKGRAPILFKTNFGWAKSTRNCFFPKKS